MPGRGGERGGGDGAAALSTWHTAAPLSSLSALARKEPFTVNGV